MVAGIGKRGLVVNPRSLVVLPRVPTLFDCCANHFSETALGTLADFLPQGRKVWSFIRLPGADSIFVRNQFNCDASMAVHDRFGSKADISQCNRHVRFTPKADMCGAARDVRLGQ
jgi:hypothetical protein